VATVESVKSVLDRGALRTYQRSGNDHTANRMAAENIFDLEDAQLRLHARMDEAFPKRYRNAGVEHPEVAAWVEEYVAAPSQARSLLIMGPIGTGKTWAAYGALRQAAVRSLKPTRAGCYLIYNWAATTFPDFIAHMRPGYFDERDDMTSAKYIQQMKSAPLLLVDDLGVSKGSEWVEDVTHRLLSGRYDDELPTIYTTNLAIPEIEKVMGARIASRLAEQCVTVRMVGHDRRRPVPRQTPSLHAV
jgi:DNA replication protein DnaC